MSYLDSIRFYIEFRIEISYDFSYHTILAALFYKIHCSLVETDVQCGLSFPAYSTKGLGAILRLHGSKDDLYKVKDVLNTTGLKDHLQCSDILEIPEEVKFAIFKRERFLDKSAIRRLTKRQELRKSGIKPQFEPKGFDLKRTKPPYLIYHSASTGEQLSFFIKKEDFNTKSMGLEKARFNKFGLSSDNASYVPIF